jgi:hypothetical protein
MALCRVAYQRFGEISFLSLEGGSDHVLKMKVSGSPSYQPEEKLAL